MWSKIKPLHLPISLKLTGLYALILGCTLLFTSLLTFTGLLYILFSQAHEDIRQSIINVAQHLEKTQEIDNRLLHENLLAPEVILKIYDEQDHLVFDSDPKIQSAPNFNHEPSRDFDTHRSMTMKKEVLQLLTPDELYFYENKKEFTINGQIYRLHFLEPMNKQNHVLMNLTSALLLANILGLLVAAIAGFFLSRRILRPIRRMTETAKEIEIKNLEKRIPLSNGNDELHELGRTFNRMLDRIQTGFEKQRRFTSDASHELRTPITVISGYADMLDRWGKDDPDARQEGIDAIKSEANNMYQLIEKLLFLARADQNRQLLKKEILTTNLLLDEIFEETQLIASDHTIRLEPNDNAFILADFVALKQMLRIFIDNSVKYTPAGGTITISGKKSAAHITLSIKDTGIGIPLADHPHVFNRFYRVDKSRAKFTGGTGLGLSIASWIAAQHGSTIDLDSRPDHGTCMSVTLPLAETGAPDVPSI